MDLLAALLLAPFSLVTLCFAVEILVGVRPLRQRQTGITAEISAIIVVPAHDEAAIIGTSVAALKSAAEASAKVLVIADNCSDATAAAAREAGVHVIERTDPARRGKGFALACARDALRTHPPQVILVIDADCRMDGDSIAQLIARCAATGRPCQATNLQTPVLTGSPAVQLSTFAFYIKNVVRQRALQRLAGRVHLLGTGMAFPWPVFDQAPLATDNIAEDLHIGIQLAEAGSAPLFVEDAIVWSDPETQGNMLAQRRRWEGGFLRNAAHAAPSVLRRSIRHGDVRGLWAAFNLFIPPLALLVLVDIAALLAGILLWLAGASALPVVILLACLLVAWIGLASAWALGGRRFVTLGSLMRIPGYVLWKVPMYLGFARRGAPQDWIRTR